MSVLVASIAACSTSSDGTSEQTAVDAGAEASVVVEGDYEWHLPAGFPKPKVPADNPISVAKVELGRRLFYDKRLSGNGTYSCASCHDPKRAFTDGLANALGSTGQVHPRSSMSLVNVGYASALTWANDLLGTLEKQALVPMFGETPVELGLVGQEQALLERLRDEPLYAEMFPKAFPGEAEAISIDHVVKSIANFERTIVSGGSAYDRYVYGHDSGALDESAKRGRDLFFSERTECFHCHGSFGFADNVSHEGTVITEMAFHNTALYNLDGQGAYPAASRGLIDISGEPRDMGRFKAPTLRNVAVTAPYMHDGSIATLGEVIDHYARGGRKIESGANAGDGAKSPLKSEFMQGFLISDAEKADLVHFLESLTDEAFLHDPRFADPWGAP
ncbi:Methylamine utilization protein mauG [Labilithrix luteola]|uniref:Methylamine utilization protein mauG n=1 Tax=Labilithrix luteola TaxID=1391654 RepID=A0A0K1PPL9_9BACT|nr:Methylamine utilization protein mauG [Labilithrix luteola]